MEGGGGGRGARDHICTYTCIHTDTYIHIDKRTVIDNRYPMIPQSPHIASRLQRVKFYASLRNLTYSNNYSFTDHRLSKYFMSRGLSTYKCTAYH